MSHGLRVECRVTGAGDPVTVFAHGLAAGIGDTRPFGGGVIGRRVFFQFRGHGGTDAPGGGWTYPDLATDLRAVADEFGADQAFATSLGAGALCRLLAETPDRFRRLVIFLPAALDQPRPGLSVDDPSSWLASQVPAAVRNTVAAQRYLRERASVLARPGFRESLAGLTGQAPVPDATVLARVNAPSLVIGCAGDPTHPATVASRLAGALACAELVMYPRPGPWWTDQVSLRARISGFLNRGH